MALLHLTNMQQMAPLSLCPSSKFSAAATFFPPKSTIQTYHSVSFLKPPNATTRKPPKSSRAVENNLAVARNLCRFLQSGSFKSALQVFENLPKRSQFIWNVFIRCLTDNEFFREAIYFYHRMLEGDVDDRGIGPDYYTFPFVIKACVGLSDLVEGERIHARVIRMGLDADLYVCNSLIVMYSKLGCLQQSLKIFRGMPVKDLVSWNSMISAYVSSGEDFEALVCFREMQASGLGFDRFGAISILGACSLLNGKEVHCQVIRRGIDLDSMIATSFVDMYGNCGLVGYSERVFIAVSHSLRTIPVWNAMIGAYARNDEVTKCFSCFLMMQARDKLVPDAVTLINLLPSCTRMSGFLQGRALHGFAIRRGIFPHLFLETSLLDMYGKCGCLSSAETIFLGIQEKNLISWNAMIAAYVHNSSWEEAIKLFLDLSLEGIQPPDETTFVNLLPAFAEIALPVEGKQIHGYIIKMGFSSNMFICNSLIYMYGKCGDIAAAEKVFDCMEYKNLISWNSIIMAFGIHGLGKVSIQLFCSMLEEGMKPNASTFVSLLTSCSISGLVDEGRGYFNSMRTEYNMEPGIEHYGCIVDIEGRTGDLQLAKLIIDEMPLVPTARIWGSLLAASRCHRDLELAELAANHVLSIENNNTGCYILLSNMYAELRRPADVERVRRSMESHGLRKTIAHSKIEHRGKVYRFTNHDCVHPKASLIYEALDIISRKKGDNLWIPHGSNMFKPADVVRRKANSTLYHSVRLAICYGLICTSIGAPVLVRKNVRMCRECHDAAKKISEIADREILVGDAKVYHHFRNGQCSCKDYW
ncbi:OLC1v1003523C1 [Oldenlandia corymbosa var. corymbosa]|uniref:OLC1v1003523C1 n=1 Tax=Oldenlandia corymbosa var. corymbosa TaxID=529605 RepID=A0AAV1DA79_OLDCO|nr:OLC1v1003523C1 [Oldenlandia corymbosa var. corymbosa]